MILVVPSFNPTAPLHQTSWSQNVPPRCIIDLCLHRKFSFVCPVPRMALRYPQLLLSDDDSNTLALLSYLSNPKLPINTKDVYNNRKAHYFSISASEDYLGLSFEVRTFGSHRNYHFPAHQVQEIHLADWQLMQNQPVQPITNTFKVFHGTLYENHVRAWCRTWFCQ
jgi:hypothetical protein